MRKAFVCAYKDRNLNDYKKHENSTSHGKEALKDKSACYLLFL